MSTARHAEILPRISATLSGLCLLLHVVLVFVAGSGMLSMSLPMLGLAALCGGCTAGAWRRRCSNGELGLTASIVGVMVSSHLILIPGYSSLAICSSAAESSAIGSIPGTSGMIGVTAGVEMLMQAGVALACIAGLTAMCVLAHRRLARLAEKRVAISWPYIRQRGRRCRTVLNNSCQ